MDTVYIATLSLVEAGKVTKLDAIYRNITSLLYEKLKTVDAFFLRKPRPSCCFALLDKTKVLS